RDRPFDLVEGHLAGGDVDRGVVGGDPAASARETNTAAELEGTPRYVHLERVGGGLEPFHASAHTARSLCPANLRRLVVSELDLRTQNFELAHLRSHSA